MAPVTVKEVLACRERLGVVQCEKVCGDLRPVRHVLLYSEREEWGVLNAQLDRTVMIFPPVFADAGVDTACSGHLSASFGRNISCVAVSETQRIPDFFLRFSEKTGTPVFASYHDAYLLKSRLMGLFRERYDRMVMVHGVLVEVNGHGVLMMGESGIGKTSCSLEITARGHHWVADDAVVLEGRGNSLFGRGHERTRNMIAIRGRGLLRADALLAAEAILEETRVDVAIRLVKDHGKCGTSKGDGFRSIYEVMGVAIPCHHLATCRDTGQTAERIMRVIDRLGPARS
jgi:serine kinase of HPr protein (carbohydrate metabolism regulator)